MPITASSTPSLSEMTLSRTTRSARVASIAPNAWPPPVIVKPSRVIAPTAAVTATPPYPSSTVEAAPSVDCSVTARDITICST
jgi:hypothetical protein